MTASAAFLRTRVARRILGLFLACAILPVAGLAWFGYRQLSADIADSEVARLRADAKSAGMMLLDRLGTAAGGLTRLAREIGTGPLLVEPDISPNANAAHPHFRAIALIRGEGTVEPVAGTISTVPALSSSQSEHVRNGGVALVLSPAGKDLRIFLVTAVPRVPGARLWGQIEGPSLWGTDPERSVAPVGTLLCLTALDGMPLSCHGGLGQLAAQARNEAASRFSWGRDGDRYVAGRWTLFLRREYAAPDWSISLSVSEASLFASLRDLQRSLWLGLVLAMGIVLALSHVQLRRSMRPLEALHAGTLRIAAAKFDEPVVVESDDEFKALADSFNQMADAIQHDLRQRAALERVQRSALVPSGEESVLEAVFRSRIDLLPGDDLAVALERPDDSLCWRLTFQEPDREDVTTRDVRPTQGELTELERAPEGLVARRGQRARSYFRKPGEILHRDVMVLPLLRRGRIAGAAVIPCRAEQEGSPEAIREGRRAVDRIAVAIANRQLVEQLDALNWGALTALARTIDAASPWTAGHSERVTLTALAIGRRLGLSPDDQDLLHRGGLLHDIGKVGVPAAILDKPGKLTAEEYETIKTHPTVGARILAPIGAYRLALPLVLHHHELLDGSGYPHGLAGDQIPRLVRVLTVADVFDALSSERPYRTAWSYPEAIAYLRENAGTKFDMEAVEALTAELEEGWMPTLPRGHDGRHDIPQRLSPSPLNESVLRPTAVV
jgi:putative nucleotidyltransferase with HDIG domain